MLGLGDDARARRAARLEARRGRAQRRVVRPLLDGRPQTPLRPSPLRRPATAARGWLRRHSARCVRRGGGDRPRRSAAPPRGAAGCVRPPPAPPLRRAAGAAASVPPLPASAGAAGRRRRSAPERRQLRRLPLGGRRGRALRFRRRRLRLGRRGFDGPLAERGCGRVEVRGHLVAPGVRRRRDRGRRGRLFARAALEVGVGAALELGDPLQQAAGARLRGRELGAARREVPLQLGEPRPRRLELLARGGERALSAGVRGLGGGETGAQLVRLDGGLRLQRLGAVERLGQGRAGEALAVDLLVERRARHRFRTVRGLGQRELRAQRLQLGRGAGVGPALRRERRVELGEPPFEVGGATRGVAADALQLRAHRGQLGADRSELALARGELPARLLEVVAGDLQLRLRFGGRGLGGSRALALGRQLLAGAGAHRGRIRGRALLGERNLLGRLLARRGGDLGVGSRARELALALRELLLEPARATALLAQRGQRDRVGGPQELAAPHPLALLAERGAEPLDGRDRGRERLGLALQPRRPSRRSRVRRRAAAATGSGAAEACGAAAPLRRADGGLRRGRARPPAPPTQPPAHRRASLRDRRSLRRSRRSGLRLQRLEAPLQLGAAQLEHLDRLERLGGALRLGALGRLRAARAALRQHRAVDDLPALLRLARGRRRRRRLEPARRRREAGPRAALPAEPELVRRRIHQRGGNEIRRAPDRRIATEPRVGQRVEAARLRAAAQPERRQLALAAVQIRPASAHADQPRVRAGGQPLDGLDREAFEGRNGRRGVHEPDAGRPCGGRKLRKPARCAIRRVAPLRRRGQPLPST